MNKKEDYTSDSSDQSDEDFCPENAAGDSDVGSEAESEDGDEDFSNDTDSENESKAKKRSASKLNNVKTIKKPENETRRTTRQADNGFKALNSSQNEKDELESDEDEDKSRSDALWADFMGDSSIKKSNKIDENNKSSSSSGLAKENDELTNGKPALGKINKTKETTPEPKRLKSSPSTDISEKLPSKKTVSKDSIKENKPDEETTTSISNKLSMSTSTTLLSKTAGLSGLKRPSLGAGGSSSRVDGAGGSGLGSILNQLGKKKKLSVLEKSQMDWKSFKQDEGIEEQLQTFNKGKDGFLERQDFLQRTDVRQFEIEKGMRQARRQN